MPLSTISILRIPCLDQKQDMPLLISFSFRRILIAVPSPGLLSTEMVPFIMETTFLIIQIPAPRAGPLMESAGTSSTKNFRSWSGSIPIPLSRTSNRRSVVSSSSSGFEVTFSSTLPPGGVYLTALESSRRSISMIRVRSPATISYSIPDGRQ